MRLKKLELSGFKSFYDKTTFEFSDGITAIVGPNGCGKSNIVDAIRWVLGEHAPSYLRSKALEDVIFVGSEAAGPLGMAEVSLTFSNDDGLGPPGYESYAEIQITRRTYRDGESEFLINRIPCRLKDIAELFLDTGAGARGYAIIEQGKIASIAEARPDEKRLIVEEAAGVAKFRVRRKEAERKMEATRQNISRVKDILEEVRRQLGSLERQVRKAERYKALKDDLRTLDLMIAARRCRDLADELARIGASLSEEEAGLLSTRADLSRLDAERETAKIRLAELEAAVQERREGHAGLKQAVTGLQAEWKAKLEETERLGVMIGENAAEISSLEEEIAGLSLRIREADEAASLRREELVAARARRAALSDAADAARARHDAARLEAGKATSDLIVRVSHHSNAASNASSLQKTQDEGERGLVRLEERLLEAGAAEEKARLELAEAARIEMSARERLAAADTAWEETGNRLSEVIAGLDAVVEARREAEGKLQAASSRLDTLRQVYERRDWASTGARAVLRHYADPAGRVESAGNGVYGIIGDMIETDARYEKAVEAILGERMQSIVVRDHDEGLSALQYLKDTGEGRGAFVPVTLRAREDAAAYAGEEGVIAPLCEVVGVPGECGDLARKLFGGALLVRDLSCAIRLWNRNGVWNSYVTLDGDVVTADGVLVGGSQGNGETGILAVRREIRDLEKEISGLTAATARLSSEEREQRQSRASLEERQAESFRAREEASAARTQAEQDRALQEASWSRERERIDSLALERDFAQSELARVRAELAESEAVARESEQVRGEEEERVRALAAEVENARVATEDAVRSAHSAEIEWAELEQKAHAAQDLLGQTGEMLAGKRSTLEDRGRRRTAYEERREALSVEIASGRASIDGAMVDLARRQEEIDLLVGEHGILSATIDAVEAASREIRRKESAAQDRISGLRLDHQRADMELATLDDQTWQRYESRPADLPDPGVDAGNGEEGMTRWVSRAEEIRVRMAGIGEVNLASLEEHKELSDRCSFLTAQKEDLEKSLDDLARAIQKINRTTRERFVDTLEKINEKLKVVFPRLFHGGGRAFLKLLDEENLLESGVELVVQLPGKNLLPLKSISGGEKSLAAASLIFSIFLVKPSPFCLLDEADAALDDANIDRFNAHIRELSGQYQFLLITHNKRTMELADYLYGITMEKAGISKVVSVKFRQ